MRSIQNLFSAVGGALMGRGVERLSHAIEESHLQAEMYTSQPRPRL